MLGLAEAKTGFLRELKARSFSVSVDDYIPEDRADDLEGLKEAALYISRLPGVCLVNPKSKKRESQILSSNKNDAIIFAKSVALSYETPVRILNSDGDFRRIANSFYRKIKTFSRMNGFSIPENPVQTYFQFGFDNITSFDNFPSRKQRTLAAIN